jgi:hypothetical protein
MAMKIVPDMKIGGTLYTSPDTDELAEIVEGLQYYAKRLHQLKLCIENTKTRKMRRPSARGNR